MERKADRKAPWCEPSQPPCLTPRKTAPRVSAPALDHRPDRRPSPVPFVLKTVGPRCKLPTRALKIAPTVSLPQLPRPCRAVNYRHGPWFCERTFAWALSLSARPPPLSLSLSLFLSLSRPHARAHPARTRHAQPRHRAPPKTHSHVGLTASRRLRSPNHTLGGCPMNRLDVAQPIPNQPRNPYVR